MASATTVHHRSRCILQLALLLLAASSTAMLAVDGACESEEFPAGRSYATCADLPTLGASLHWTYDAAVSSLSLAFAAKPPGASGAGWVAWGINPTGDGMKGAQTLVAFKSSGAYVVNTYNLTGYRPLSAASTPIALEATELAADGKVRLYGTLQLPKGMEAVNHIWQVGSTVANEMPAKHAFAQENLEAKGSLVLTGAGATDAAPAPVAAGPSAEEATGNLETETAPEAAPAPLAGAPSTEEAAGDLETGTAPSPAPSSGSALGSGSHHVRLGSGVHFDSGVRGFLRDCIISVRIKFVNERTYVG
ncbi:auxin-induced in root cultures protein 12-like [Triticum aestivum]|uniref:auxin-induced in root cultures protein 12-like n=1 Tax=Triticum aestivum TaxID=4565 RepID=UPI001D031683|nr:auxin-induced in root cultures protein 12-like [Triticum aestivum]